MGKCFLCILSSLALSTTSSLAATIVPAPAPKPTAAPIAPPPKPAQVPGVAFHWVDVRGQPVKVAWPHTTRWVRVAPPAPPPGTPASETPPPSQLALRSQFKFAGPVQVLSLKTSQHATIAKVQGGFVVDLYGISSGGMVSVKTPNGQLIQLSFEATALIHAPWVETDPACQEAGLWLQPPPPKGAAQKSYPHLYALLSCRLHDDRVEVEFVHSSDAQIARSDFRASSSAPQWIRFAKALPREESVVGQRSLGVIDAGVVRNDAGGAVSGGAGGAVGSASAPGTDGPREIFTYTLMYAPPRKAPRFSWGPGLGVTYVDYKEDRGSVHSHGPALSGKIDVSYQLIPRKVDIAANAFMTILPLTTQDGGQAAFRSFGLNGRIGYRLPINLGAIDWSFLGGFYLWGMLVPSNAYGASYLLGPQLFVMMRSQQAGHRSYYAYVKLASISETIGFSVSNRELAGGGGFQLTSGKARRLVFLTLDLAHALFRSEEQRNGLALLTTTLGVSTRF